MPGVNVILTNAEGELFGAAADTDGFYVISRVPGGSYQLKASFIGFKDFEQAVVMVAGEIQSLNIELVVDDTTLGELVVEGARETAGVANITAGLQTIRPADISLVPSPDISADLVNYLTALPGVVSQGDRGGQLFIRGGEPTQNMVLLDGMQIFQPFHIVGFFSAFPSDIINTADVYAGGYGSKFGGRLSSVIDITARTGNKRRFVGAATLAPF
ncbi:MAG TPA: TonB-dependent receptor, partial [Bacteroidetes bacterium]|nr:TonB-dependent receptor [Bacteroidota bacterium]